MFREVSIGELSNSSQINAILKELKIRREEMTRSEDFSQAQSWNFDFARHKIKFNRASARGMIIVDLNKNPLVRKLRDP